MPSGPETRSMLAAINTNQTNDPRTPRRMPETAGQDLVASEHETYDEEDFTYSLFGPIRTVRRNQFFFVLHADILEGIEFKGRHTTTNIYTARQRME